MEWELVPSLFVTKIASPGLMSVSNPIGFDKMPVRFCKVLTNYLQRKEMHKLSFPTCYLKQQL